MIWGSFMIDFKPIVLSDKDWVDPLLKASDFKGCEYSFANNFTWSNASNIEIANYNDRYVVKWGTDKPCFLFPAGIGDLKSCIDAIIEYCDANDIKLRFYNVPATAVEQLKDIYSDLFDYEPCRDSFDYIYDSTDLIQLKGKKYHSKRNYINRFNNLNWKFEELNESNIDECVKMNDEWCIINNCSDDKSKSDEASAVKNSLKYFKELSLSGGLIRLDGKVVAFSIGEQLSSDTYVVHIEKAFSDVAGAYPLINREFAKHYAKDYKYINREDDVGSEGLRKAKLSYYPTMLYEKYIVTKK